jgi:hypothetical protein
MDTKCFPSRINSYLVLIPKHLGDILRLLVAVSLFTTAACTENKTINQTNPPVSQAGGQTRTSDPDGWGGGSTGDGGGGQGVLCSSEANDGRFKNRLVIRDLYEAEVNFKQTIKSNKLGKAGSETIDEESYKFLMQLIERHFGPKAIVDFSGDVNYWKQFFGQVSFLPENSKLLPSQDANSPIAIPVGCKLVQIAYWSEPTGASDAGILFIDKNYWIQLDQVNKIALMAHEFFFKRARAGGFQNSDYVRKKIGYLFSEQGLPPMFQDWVPSKNPKLKGLLPESSKGFMYCQGNNMSGVDQVEYFRYINSKGEVVNLWSAIKVGKHEMPPFDSISRTFDYHKQDEKLYAILSDRLPMNTVYSSHKIKEEDKLGVEFADEIVLNQEDTTYPVIFPTADGVGGISFVNLFNPFIPTNKRKALPAEQLVNLLLSKAVDAFLTQENKDKGFNRTAILDGLAVLNIEIEEAIKRGAWSDFSKWKAALKSLEEKGAVLTEENRKFLDEIVSFNLYIFKFGYYKNSDVQFALGDAGFERTHNSTNEKGQMAATVDNEHVNYFVYCYSYDDLQDVMDRRMTGGKGNMYEE